MPLPKSRSEVLRLTRSLRRPPDEVGESILLSGGQHSAVLVPGVTVAGSPVEMVNSYRDREPPKGTELSFLAPFSIRLATLNPEFMTACYYKHTGLLFKAVAS